MRVGKLEEALAYQKAILQGVSRSFALTIPLLPENLSTAVTNAYLLCRIADTIEDDVNLSATEVREFQSEFIRVLRDGENPDSLVAALAPRLSESTLAAERDLVGQMHKIVLVTNQFNPGKRDTLIRCVEVMCQEMPDFQRADKHKGLATMEDMNHYCYAVAGVVGEMLTELFCNYSDKAALNSQALMRLAPSFGQGLQMTNILKDVWDDWREGNCWLPADIFAEAGYDIGNMSPDHDRQNFNAGLSQLVGKTHGHLKNALEYALLIPAKETGIRKFLLWNVHMAVATIRRISQSGVYTSGDEVKISKLELLKVITLTNAAVRSDNMLRAVFAHLGKGLPYQVIEEQFFDQAASLSSF